MPNRLQQVEEDQPEAGIEMQDTASQKQAREEAEAKAKAKAEEAAAQQALTTAKTGAEIAKTGVLAAMDKVKQEQQLAEAELKAKDSLAIKQESQASYQSKKKLVVDKLQEFGKPGLMQSYDMCMRELQALCLQFAEALNARHHSVYGYPMNPELSLVKVAVGLAAEVVKAPFTLLSGAREVLSDPQKKFSEAYNALADTSIGKHLLNRSVELSREMMNKSFCDESGKIHFQTVKDLCPGVDEAMVPSFDKLVEKTQMTLLAQAGYRMDDHNVWKKGEELLTPATFDAIKQDPTGALSKLGVKVVDEPISWPSMPSRH